MHMVAPVPVQQPWRIWVNMPYENTELQNKTRHRKFCKYPGYTFDVSWQWNDLRIIDLLWGKSVDRRWISLTKSSNAASLFTLLNKRSNCQWFSDTAALMWRHYYSDQCTHGLGLLKVNDYCNILIFPAYLIFWLCSNSTQRPARYLILQYRREVRTGRL